MTEFRFTASVHGHSVVPQLPGPFSPAGGNHYLEVVEGIPWTDIFGLRQGPGVKFRGAPIPGAADPTNRNYFHVSIPVNASLPAYFPDRVRDTKTEHHYRLVPVRVSAIRLDCVATPGADIVRMYAFDGDNMFGSQDGPGRRWGVQGRSITKGLGVSFEVLFSAESEITFNGVSAELVVELP